MALTFWQESVPGGQVSGRSGYSAPRLAFIATAQMDASSMRTPGLS
jgi:hypothetical protein